jgi:hypothetical protein
MVQNMGCPEEFDIRDAEYLRKKRCQHIPWCWTFEEEEFQMDIIRKNTSQQGTYRVSMWLRTKVSRMIWGFYWWTIEKLRRGLDRDNPHFYFEFYQ